MDVICFCWYKIKYGPKEKSNGVIAYLFLNCSENCRSQREIRAKHNDAKRCNNAHTAWELLLIVCCFLKMKKLA